MKTFKNQTELFNHIWETREHVSELSGEQLLHKGHPQWHWQFLHILPKGSYPAFKLREDNIILGTIKEHENQESIPKFKELYAIMKRKYYKEVYGKEFD